MLNLRQNVFSRLIQDESGFVLSTELILISTILVIGMVVGLTTLRDQVITELADVADGVSAIDHSYQYFEINVATHGSVAGTTFDDAADFCDLLDTGAQGTGSLSTCVSIDEGDAAEGVQDPSSTTAGDSI